MPSGKYITKEDKANILKLKALGLTRIVMTIRTGLCLDTIARIIHESREEKNNGYN